MGFFFRRLNTSAKDFQKDVSSKSLSEEMSTSLSQPLINCPSPAYPDVGSETFHTNITKLSNGLTIASQPKFGTFCTVGGMLILSALSLC